MTTPERAITHFDLAMELMREHVRDVQAENERLKKLNGLSLNKAKAARYLGYSPRQLSRLAEKYPGRLSFCKGQLSIEQLDAFEAFYKKQKGVHKK